MSAVNNTNPKVKVLLFGSVDSVESAQILAAKLQSLHRNTKAGPFHVAFATCTSAAALEYWMRQPEEEPPLDETPRQTLEIPVYLQDTNATAAAAAAAAILQTPPNHSRSGEPANVPPPESKQQRQTKDEEEHNQLDASSTASTSNSSSACLQLAPNLFVLRDARDTRSDPVAAGIWRVPIPTSSATSSATASTWTELVVASLCPQYREDTDGKGTGGGGYLESSSLAQTLSHVSYVGCDFLFTSEWPQGIETLLRPQKSDPEDAAPNTTTHRHLVSYDVAHVAAKARARYHVALRNTTGTTADAAAATSASTSNSASGIFHQSPAFLHIPPITATTITQGGREGSAVRHTGRFLALCSVPSSSNSTDDKAKKFVHAVGVAPLHSQGASTNDQNDRELAKAAPNPFTDIVYPVDDSKHQEVPNAPPGMRSTTTTTSSGLSEAAARRILAEERRVGNSGMDRWATTTKGAGQKRSRSQDQQTHEERQPVDPNNSTLFAYGLHRDVSGRLQSDQGDVFLLQAFSKYGASKVRKPPGAGSGNNTSSFCFLEFPTHQGALACLDATAGKVSVAGVDLVLKWATSSAELSTNNKDNLHTINNSTDKRQRLTESEARDSSAVYFKFTVEKNDSDTPLSILEMGEMARQWMEHTLESALAGDDCNAEDVVKAADEPALQVKLRLPTANVEQKRFGFLDFASHAAASMALATLTGSTDGGRVLMDQQAMYAKTKNVSEASSAALLSPTIGFYFNWAQSARMETTATEQDKKAWNLIEDEATHFQFERKHFPADSRKDCWFCLASASCEMHLVTGVYNTCYAAMPKGPVHPGHVLLVPVQHSSQGAWKDPAVAQEMQGLKEKLRRHALSAYDADLFVFERAIQTRGGYHTHVQCIPVKRQLGISLQSTMLAQARKVGIELREINSDVGIESLLSNSSNDDEDDDCSGYFYAEVPIATGTDYRRFLYQTSKQKSSLPLTSGHAKKTTSVPLQFGREILAAVLGQPELAHWKSCLLEHDQEAAMATAFLESFSQVVQLK